jgi:hypothetical protein
MCRARKGGCSAVRPAAGAQRDVQPVSPWNGIVRRDSGFRAFPPGSGNPCTVTHTYGDRHAYILFRPACHYNSL